MCCNICHDKNLEKIQMENNFENMEKKNSDEDLELFKICRVCGK